MIVKSFPILENNLPAKSVAETNSQSRVLIKSQIMLRADGMKEN